MTSYQRFRVLFCELYFHFSLFDDPCYCDTINLYVFMNLTMSYVCTNEIAVMSRRTVLYFAAMHLRQRQTFAGIDVRQRTPVEANVMSCFVITYYSTHLIHCYLLHSCQKRYAHMLLACDAH